MESGNVLIKPNITIDVDVTKRKDVGVQRRSFLVPPLPWLNYDENGKPTNQKGESDNGT